MRWLLPFRDALEAEYPRLFLWATVGFAGGVGVYFTLPFEPALPVAATLGSVALLTSLYLMFGQRGMHQFLIVLTLLGFGYAWAKARSELVRAPVLEKRHYGPVVGQVVQVSRSASNQPRLLLSNVSLPGLRQASPLRVRVALHKGQGVPPIGTVVMLTAHLSPPPGPVEPLGFDFQRHAWFQSLGAVGYSRTPVMVWRHADPDTFALRLAALRQRLNGYIQSQMSPRNGGIAVAITTGDRSALDRGVVEALRRANLAHLLAISGLHMGLLTAIIFGGLRAGMALMPVIAHCVNPRKVAAVAAMAVGGGYLLLSGGQVATERAYIMVLIIMGAILLDRRALTLRAVAVAVWVVLLLRPEALVSPGFQMSFAATSALVVVFSAISMSAAGRGRRVARWVVSSVVSAAVAGMATAPFAGAHFNMMPHYGVVANVVAVPIMGVVVMPALVVAGILAPLGLAAPAFWVADQGVGAIVAVAEQVSAWPHSVSLIPTPPAAVVPMFAIAGCVLCIAGPRLRWGGAALAVVASMLWATHNRPDILVTDTGGLVGIMGSEGRVLSKPKGDGFAARVWLENDADPATHARAALRPLPLRPIGVTWVSAKDAATLTCPASGYVVTPAWRTGAAGCPRIIDRAFLGRTGALQGRIGDDGTLQWRSTRDVAGVRPWNGFGGVQ